MPKPKDPNTGPITMLSVREHSEAYPVELVRDSKSGRLCIRAQNEGGNNETLIDLLDLIGWLERNKNWVRPLVSGIGWSGPTPAATENHD